MAVASALQRAGFEVFTPLFSAHSRIDLIASDGVELRRVQCKTARLQGEVLFFRTCSNTRNSPRDYTGEVDAFGVYAPDRELVYLVNSEGLGPRGCCLRLAPTRNGQAAGVRWAADYLLGPP